MSTGMRWRGRGGVLGNGKALAKKGKLISVDAESKLVKLVKLKQPGQTKCKHVKNYSDRKFKFSFDFTKK